MPKTIAVLERGTEIAGFRVESLLAEGGMGTVYLATQVRLDREVALKVLSADRSHDEEFQQRFIRESKLAASLDHPNVLPVYDAGEVDGVIYLAMRYVDGGDLRQLLRENGRVSALLALDICRQIALALDAAHAAGLVHRDVKPANILLGSNDHAYLADFGLARSKDTRGLTQTGTIMGTPDYAAPEQLEGVRALDGRADIYSLGCVLYHCLAGQPPYVRESEVGVITAHLHDPVPQLAQLRPDLPPAVGTIVNKAMEKDRSQRYNTARDLAAALGAVLTDLGGIDATGAPRVGDSGTHPLAVAAAATGGRTKTVLDRVDAQTPIALATEPGKRKSGRVSRRVGIGIAAVAVIAIGALAGGLLLRQGKASVPSIAAPGAITHLEAFPRSKHAIVHFNIHRSKLSPLKSLSFRTEHGGNRGAWTSFTATTSPRTIRGLTNGEHYRLQLRACNRRGCTRSGWTPVWPYGRPFKPQSVELTPVGGSVNLTWKAPKSNGRKIKRYLITLFINGVQQGKFKTKQLKFHRNVGYSTKVAINLVAIDKTRRPSKPAGKWTRTGPESSSGSTGNGCGVCGCQGCPWNGG